MLRLAEKLRSRLVSLPRRQKRLIQVAMDVVLVWSALWLAFVVRLGDSKAVEPLAGHAWLFALAPVIAIPLFVRFGMYRAVMRYFGNDALLAIGKAVTLSALILALAVYWYQGAPKLVPRSMVLNYWWLSLVLLGGLRLLMRQYFMGDWFSAEQPSRLQGSERGLPKVAIYGAGAAGNQLIAALRLGRAMRPVAFIDDDSGIANRSIAGLRVYTSKHIQQMINETGANEILLAHAFRITLAQASKILEALEKYPAACAQHSRLYGFSQRPG